MGAPVHAFLAYARALLIVVSCTSLVGITISRVYIFYESYTQFTLKLSEEEWLRSQCKV